MTQLEPWVTDADLTGAVVFRCGCCKAVDWQPLCPAAAVAWVHGRMFTPTVPLPLGWIGVDGGPESGFLCGHCARRYELPG